MQRQGTIPFLKALPLFLLIASSGCEVGHSWFSMSSDSPMPWFGFDLMPRRKTTQVLPSHRRDSSATYEVATRPFRNDSKGNGSERVWSKELHLPSIPVCFDSRDEERISFTGPTGPFTR